MTSGVDGAMPVIERQWTTGVPPRVRVRAGRVVRAGAGRGQSHRIAEQVARMTSGADGAMPVIERSRKEAQA